MQCLWGWKLPKNVEHIRDKIGRKRTENICYKKINYHFLPKRWILKIFTLISIGSRFFIKQNEQNSVFIQVRMSNAMLNFKAKSLHLKTWFCCIYKNQWVGFLSSFKSSKNFLATEFNFHINIIVYFLCLAKLRFWRHL